ncbi:MAG: DUF4097 domain-containing protein [Acidobacteriota bacterium]
MMRFIKSSLILAVSVLLAGSSGWAQQPERFAVPLSNPGQPARLEVNLMSGGITVKTQPGNEVIVEARIEQGEREAQDSPESKARPDVEAKARGMKRLTIPTAGLEIEEENNRVSVQSSSLRNVVNVVIFVPAASSVKLNTVKDGDILIEGVTGEIEAGSTTGSITLKGVSGAAVANAVTGEIDAAFTRLAPDKTMSFTTLNGDIDLTLPADARARLNIKSQMGEIFSDFDMTTEVVTSGPETAKPAKAGKYRVKIERAIVGTINGGGPEIQFKTFTGNIYIRKAGK